MGEGVYGKGKTWKHIWSVLLWGFSKIFTFKGTGFRVRKW